MERRYYSRQNYNQLKIRQYEEYIKKLNKYYLYMKRNYEDYIKKQNQQYINTKKYYEEYIKMQKKQYLYMQNNYEEYIKKQNSYYLYNKKYDEENYKINNDIVDTTQNEFFDFFKTLNIEDNNINDDRIKRSISEISEVNNKEINLEYKDDDLSTNEYLDNKSNNINTNITDSPKGKLLEEIYDELCEENDKKFIEEGYKVKEGYKEDDKKYSNESYEKLLKVDDKKLINENYNNVVKNEISKKNNIQPEPLYANLPVLLAETNITISVEDTISLDEEVSEIKRIKMNVLLTKSNLIPFQSNTHDTNSGVLFVTGFIRNNIEYLAKTSNEEKAEGRVENSYGNIKYCIVEVPFNFTTRITYIRKPIFTEKANINDFEFFNNHPKEGDVYENSIIKYDTYEQSIGFTEVFNEKPFAELIKATFIDVNINKKQSLVNDAKEEQEFTKIEERIIVNLVLRVLQKQQLKVGAE
ncbi:CsxC family protein [Clostridium sp. D46t1_190503_E9]|uniref:CsxC family protein n=1 Tax=Clostridium sp. D46t1_190503_E9 TaxID=2787137 RepID=UPI00189BF393|nr:hypothetical protein [Clostridium sp. D46t1_190503_E9]